MPNTDSNNLGPHGNAPRSDAPWAVILAVCALSSLATYALPEYPLTKWPWAASFTDAIANWIPGIDRLAGITKMPEVVRFYMALQWAVWAPICFGIIFKYARPKYGRMNERSMIMAMRVAQARWWYAFLGPPCSLLMIWLLVALPFMDQKDLTTPFGHLLLAMGESRFWLGLFGSFFVFAASACAYAFFKTFTIVRLAYSVRASSPLYRKRDDK